MFAMKMKERSRTPIEWAFYGVGLITTVLVTIYVTHIAKKALENSIES
jgi:bacteriorhodopsin